VLSYSSDRDRSSRVSHHRNRSSSLRSSILALGRWTVRCDQSAAVFRLRPVRPPSGRLRRRAGRQWRSSLTVCGGHAPYVTLILIARDDDWRHPSFNGWVTTPGDLHARRPWWKCERAEIRPWSGVSARSAAISVKVTQPSEQGVTMSMATSIAKRLAIVTALSASLALSAPTARAADMCATDGTTIAADSIARVYGRSIPPAFVAFGVYGCLYGHAPLAIASESAPMNPLFKVALSGRYVAVAADTFQPFFAQATLRVFDLRAGRTIRQPPSATSGPSGISLRSNSLITIRDVVLSGKAVAWIVQVRNLRGQVETPDLYEVLRVDRRRAVLDSGPRIAPGSLAISSNGRRIYWLDGAAIRSAPL
jgi:hypothetical protein